MKKRKPRRLILGLPIPTKILHEKIVKMMAPFIADFQKAVDEQTQYDFKGTTSVLIQVICNICMDTMQIQRTSNKSSTFSCSTCPTSITVRLKKQDVQ